MHRVISPTIWLTLTVFAAAVHGAEYHVAPSGSDLAAGTAAAPWGTLSHAARAMVAGDRWLVHAGTYRECVRPEHSGTAAEPIVFAAAGDGEVVVHGGEPVADWTPDRDGVYTASVAERVEDLFVDGRPMLLACWPNQSWSPQAGFNRQRWVVGTGDPPAGVHAAGGLALRPDMAWTTRPLAAGEPLGKGVLFGPRELLDAEGEWCWHEGTLSLIPPAGQNPQALRVERKVRTYGFDLSGRSHVTVQGMTVFAASINLDSANHCLVEGCRVLYHCPQFVASYARRAENGPTIWGKGVVLGGRDNTLRGCEIAHSWGDGVTGYGSGNTVEQCHVHDCDWSVTDAALIGMSGGGHRITRNTLHECSRTGIVARCATAASAITYNDVYDYGRQTYDLGGIYIGWRQDSRGLVVAYNWFHDSHATTEHEPKGGNSGPGLYSDGNYNAIWHHNVVWNVGRRAMQVNPHDFDKGSKGDWIPVPQPFADMQVFNNTCVGAIEGLFEGGVRLKTFNNLTTHGTVGDDQQHNVTGRDIEAGFADLHRGDFRLRPGARAIDAGRVILGVTDGFVGAAPDAGAYEFGGVDWVPGAAPRAFGPIPAEPSPRPARLIPAGDVDDSHRLHADIGVSQVADGAWACYRRVDFGVGVNTCTVRVGVEEKFAGRQVEFRIGGLDGPVIGSLTVAGTGGWRKMASQAAPIRDAAGVHDLYVLFKGGPGAGNFESFRFE